MAMITLLSAAGSPGVTTTAVGLGLTSSRLALIVEADPTGGSAVLAGFFRGASEHTGALLDLVWAQRHGRLAEELPHSLVPFPDSSASLLPGVRSHAQSRNVLAIWEPLTTTLKGLRATGQDVIVDAGRLGLTEAPEPLMYAGYPFRGHQQTHSVLVRSPLPGGMRVAEVDVDVGVHGDLFPLAHLWALVPGQ